MFRLWSHITSPLYAQGYRRAFNSGGTMIIPLVLRNDYQESAFSRGGASIMTRLMRLAHDNRTLRATRSIFTAGMPTNLQKIRFGSTTVKTYRRKVTASPRSSDYDKYADGNDCQLSRKQCAVLLRMNTAHYALSILGSKDPSLLALPAQIRQLSADALCARYSVC